MVVAVNAGVIVNVNDVGDFRTTGLKELQFLGAGRLDVAAKPALACVSRRVEIL
jgi:hypothetical protein